MSGRKTTPTAPTPEQELALLRAQLASLSRDNESLAAENARLAAEAAEGAAALSEMSARVASLQSTIDSLVERIKLANLRYFAPRSERVPDDQMCLSLFNDAEAWADPGEPEPGPARGGDAPARPRRRGGRRRIDTSKLERVVVEHDLEDRKCPQCGAEMVEMKVEVTEVIRLVPAHLEVEEHRRHVYRCKACCAANAAGEDVASQIVRAPMPALTPIPGSFVTASTLSWVINAKYANSLPYYRLERDFLELGAEVSRQDMANWTIGPHRPVPAVVGGGPRLLQAHEGDGRRGGRASGRADRGRRGHGGAVGQLLAGCGRCLENHWQFSSAVMESCWKPPIVILESCWQIPID